MGNTANLPRSGQGDPAETVTMEFVGESIKTVTTTASLISSGQRRTAMFIQNYSDQTASIYVGATASVASSGANRGIEIPVGASIELKWAETIPVYAIAASGSQSVKVVEQF